MEHGFACLLSFSSMLNPSLDTNPESKKIKEILIAKTTKVVRAFMYDEVRTEFRDSYPESPVKPEIGFKPLERGALLEVDIILPDQGNMEQTMEEVAERLQTRLTSDLSVPELNRLRGKFRVTVGPPVDSRRA